MPPNLNSTIKFDPVAIQQDNELQAQSSTHSLGMSTASHTTGTTHLKLREVKLLNVKFLAELKHTEQLCSDSSVQTSKTTVSTRAKLLLAQQELETLKATLMARETELTALHKGSTPSSGIHIIPQTTTPTTPPTGAIPDGVGQDP